MWNKADLLNAIADLLMLVGAAALLAAGAIWLVRAPSLPVRQVVFVEALEHTRRIEVEQMLPAALKGNFFNVNVEQVRNTLEQLPWVRHAEVRRVWPSKLEVRIEEHRPVARWGEGRGELVNSFGEVFSAVLAETDAAKLPLLSGPAGTAPEVLKRYGEFVEAFAQMNARPVQVALSSRLAWQTRLDSGMLLELGHEQTKAPIGVRLARFIEVYPGSVAQKSQLAQVVDLRYPNGFAMRVAADGKGK